MTKGAVFGSIAAAIGVIVVLVWLGLWGWLLLASDPLSVPVSQYPIWPVACSTKGCVTFASWNTQHHQETMFATLTNSQAPTKTASLTNILRRHIVNNAFLQSPVTLADATAYRETILQLKDIDVVEKTLGIPIKEYDKNIVLPFLEQEALRIQHKVESTEELYGQLTQDRSLILFSTTFSWDKQKGTVQ